MSKPRELTPEEARVMLQHTVDGPVLDHWPSIRTIEIMTEEFGMIEVSEEDYYRYYDKFK